MCHRLKTDLCPIGLEYDAHENHQRDDENDHSTAATKAASAFRTEFPLTPIIDLVEQKELHQPGKATLTFIGGSAISIVHSLPHIYSQPVGGSLVQRDYFNQVIL